MSTWPLRAVGDLLSDARSGFAFGGDVADGVFQLRMNNLRIDGSLDLTKKRRVPASSRRLTEFLAEPGDVFFNATNSPELVGKTAYFPGLDEPATFSNHFFRLRPNPESLDGRFLARWLNQQFERGVFRGMSRQWVNQASVGRDALLALAMPTPPLPEQRRIAAILDKADALRAKRRAALAKLEGLAQAIFVEMFGDPALSSRWERIRLGELAQTFSDGPFGSHLKSEHYCSDGVRVVRLQNIGVGEFLDTDKAFISDAHFARLSKHKCLPGDVLVGTLGKPNLRACILPATVPIALNKADCVQIRANPRKARAEYICALLNHPSTERMAHELMRGETRVRISMGRLRSLRVPAPPLEVQIQFAARINALEGMKAIHARGCGDFDRLFSSLQHHAFRGEL